MKVGIQISRPSPQRIVLELVITPDTAQGNVYVMGFIVFYFTYLTLYIHFVHLIKLLYFLLTYVCIKVRFPTSKRVFCCRKWCGY